MTWIAKLSDYDRDADRRHAREMLAGAIPFSQWRIGRSAEDTRMYLLIMRGTMKVADLAPDEYEHESVRLELDAAIAFAGGE